jgi:hypothetical protein
MAETVDGRVTHTQGKRAVRSVRETRENRSAIGIKEWSARRKLESVFFTKRFSQEIERERGAADAVVSFADFVFAVRELACTASS